MLFPRPSRFRLPTLLGAAACFVLAAQSSRGDEKVTSDHPTASNPVREGASESQPVEARCTRPVVFLYHGFDRGRGELSIGSSVLEAHLTWLERNHVEIISMARFVAFLQGSLQLPSRVALLTIDDGEESVYTRAWPILRRHRAPFVLGLPTRLMESRSRGMLSWDQVREMTDSGLAEVASHGHEHRGLVHFGAAQAARELALSRRIIEERTGHVPVAFFYPLGAASPRAEQYVRDAGFSVAFTAQGAPIAQQSVRPYRIPRVTVQHRHDLRGLAWFYGPKFWQLAAPSPSSCP